MTTPKPPPLPSTKPATGGWPRRILIALVIVGTIPVLLRLFGLIIPYTIPTGGMEPAIARGDNFIMENFTFLVRKPRRGDIIVFKTDDLPWLPPGQDYIKRVVGGPGERLRIADGKLFVNDIQVALNNAAGEIRHENIPRAEHLVSSTDVFTVLGDNTLNSMDSRFCGPVPAKNIKGRAMFCYWPLNRIGGIK